MTKHDDSDFIVDASWCDPDDLWGINVSGCTVAQANPPLVFSETYLKRLKAKAPASAVRLLASYGIKLSSNLKTVFCFSTWFDTCWRTAWCREFCYGKSTRFTHNVNQYQSNSMAMASLVDAPQRDVDEVAAAFREICLHYEMDNIRWSGIGDLTLGAVRLIDAITQDENFTVWGFTRRGNMLADEMPVRDNVVFWCSVDNTMSNARIQHQINGAQAHGMHLAYASVEGLRFRPRPLKPSADYAPRVIAAQPIPQPDEFLLDLMDESPVPVSVIFGFHGKGRTTHVDVDTDGVPMINGLNECPATDPLGGGHMQGTCQQCGFCQVKPAQQEYESLMEHRLNRVVVDDFGRDVSLDDNQLV